MKRIFAITLLFIFGIWMYYPALSLPPSVVDDWVWMRNSRQFVTHYHQSGFADALRQDVSSVLKLNNPGFSMLRLAFYTLTGYQPFHWIRLAQLAVACCFIFQIIRLSVPAPMFRFGWALLGPALFLAGDVPGSIDFQSLRANWFRLHTTDADALLFLVIHAWAAMKLLSAAGCKVRTGWWMLALITACGTFLVKLPYIAPIMAALFAVTMWLAIVRRGKDSIQAASLLLAILALLGTFIGAMRKLNSGTTTGNEYGQQFSFKPAHLLDGLQYYVCNYTSIIGPAFVVVLALLVLTVVLIFRRRNKLYGKSAACVIYGIVLFGLAAGIYVPWDYRLPRYMLAGWLALSVFIPLSILYVRPLFKGISIGHWLAGAMAAFVAIVMGPAAAAVGMAGLLVICFRRRLLPFGLAALACLGVTGLTYFASIVPLIRSGLNDYMVAKEHANWQAYKVLNQYVVQGEKFCYVGDGNDEQIGSLAGYVHETCGTLDMDYKPTMAECTSGTIVVVNHVLSTGYQESATGEWKLIREIALPRPDIRVPFSFWRYRENLLSKNQPKVPWETWPYSFIWRFYRQ